jgi:hypothetical protein
MQAHFFPLEAPSCPEAAGVTYMQWGQSPLHFHENEGKIITSVRAKGFCLMVLLLEVNFIKRLRNKSGSPKKIFRIIVNFEKIEYLLNIVSVLISYHILSYLINKYQGWPCHLRLKVS